jgi:probable HAF family extracellular repeat protein
MKNAAYRPNPASNRGLAWHSRSERLGRLLLGAICAGILASAWNGLVWASDEYDFFLVEAFDPNYDLREVMLRDINESGRVSGTATDQGSYSGFVWTQATDKVIVPMTWPQGINNLDQVVSDGQIYSFQTGQSTAVPPAGTWPVPRLQAINDQQVAVGFSECSCSNSNHTIQEALVWDAQHSSRTIPVPAAKELLRINNGNFAAGNIRGGSAGSEGFLYDVVATTWVNLTDLLPPYQFGRGWSELQDLNEVNVVCGRGWDGTAIRGLTWSEGAGFTFLPAIPGGLVDRVYPRGINTAGTVVGFADLTLHSPRAFVWDQVHGMRNLNDLVTAPPNFILDWAIKVNDQGWIVGIGHYGPAWGTSRGFVLRPLNVATGIGDPVAAPTPALAILANPVTDRLVMRVSLPETGRARLSIFDVTGRSVVRVLDESMASGERLVSWSFNRSQPAGVYYARLEAPGFADTQRFVLVR